MRGKYYGEADEPDPNKAGPFGGMGDGNSDGGLPVNKDPEPIPGVGNSGGGNGEGSLGNSEKPRDWAVSQALSSPNVTSTPRKPNTPDIKAGSVSQGSGGGGGFSSQPSPVGVLPFEPMQGGSSIPSIGGPVGTPGASSSKLFGFAGGLKGGGLGVPGQPQGDGGQSGLIDSLMAFMKQRKGGMF